MIFRLALIGLITLFFSVSLQGQNDFRPGYIIKSSGDTLKGWVAYREGQSQYTECHYKPTAKESESISYQPQELKGYGFDKEGNYLVRPFTVKDQEEMVFAKILAHGKLNLLKIFEDFYIEDQDKN